MNKGAGNVTRINKVEPPVAATVTAARNGLTLVGTNVELGGANPLIHATAIELGAFSLTATRAGNGVFLLNPGARRYAIGELTAANQTFFDVDDTNQTIFANHSSGKYLYLDMGIRIFTLGDHDSTGNDTKFVVKDTSQAASMEAGLSPSLLTLTGTPGSESLILNIAASPYFSVDLNTNLFMFGDLGGIVNQTNLVLADTAQQGSISSNSFTMLFLDMANGIFQLGASAGGTPNTTYFEVDDVNQKIQMATGGNVNGMMISANPGNISAEIGDTATTVNSTVFRLSDLSQTIRMFANNGVGINTTPTLSPFSVSGLQNFANNAAAVLGGLGVGDFYRLSAAGTSAVMVVQ